MRRIVSIVFFTLLCVVAFPQNNAADNQYPIADNQYPIADSLIAHYLELDEYTVTARVKEKDIIIPQTLSGINSRR